MNLYEAIYQRRSVRIYNMEPLEERTLSHIENLMKSLRAYRDNIDYEFKIVENLKEDSGLSGAFQVKAPYYLILTSEIKEDYLINAGFLIQQMVLYLTAMNIGTCYQGAIKPKTKLKTKLKYDFVIAVAFGKSPKDIYRAPEKANRLSEERVTVYKEEVDDLLKTIISAGIYAPSAFNSQPWRFVVYKNRIHVFCKKARLFSAILNDMKLLDIGVVLANISQAAEELWLSDSFIEIDSFKEKDFRNNEYIISVVLKEKIF